MWAELVLGRVIHNSLQITHVTVNTQINHEGLDGV